jgi:uroporphyrin-III C-methyltransferase / precorrin-2 dehydrogenase / sirohydrochlorin ferrochelatase
MNQLPIFVTLRGRKVVLVGEGEAAEAKRRLIERAGGICVDTEDREARLAFIACDEFMGVMTMLKARGLLVNVVDQPEHCDFTTPAIVDRDPVLIAIGTGGASAGLAKALRQRLETMLPQSLGRLAVQLSEAREKLRQRWPDGAARRKAIDDALSESGPLDPLCDHDAVDFDRWLNGADHVAADRLVVIILHSIDPDELTLKQARLLGQADHIWHDANVPSAILARARADAARHLGKPSEPLPTGLILHLQLQSGASCLIS